MNNPDMPVYDHPEEPTNLEDPKFQEAYDNYAKTKDPDTPNFRLNQYLVQHDSLPTNIKEQVEEKYEKQKQRELEEAKQRLQESRTSNQSIKKRINLQDVPAQDLINARKERQSHDQELASKIEGLTTQGASTEQQEQEAEKMGLLAQLQELGETLRGWVYEKSVPEEVRAGLSGQAVEPRKTYLGKDNPLLAVVQRPRQETE